MKPTSENLVQFLAQPEDGLFYVGHASILVKLSGKKFLFDVVFNGKPYGNTWFFFPELVTSFDLNEIDGVFVSHCHQDHFDIAFLKQMKDICPLYVIDGRPEFNSILEKNDLQPVLIPPDTRHPLVDDIEVYGFLHETNGIDSSIVIANPNFSVYHGNDNYIQPGRLEVLKQMYGGIDVGCIPYAYIHWYPFLLNNFSPAEKAVEAEKFIHQYYDLAIAQAKAMNAKVVIPFGANLVYHDDAYSEMNLSVKTPIEFENYALEKLGPGEGAKFKALFADDVVIKAKDGSLLVNAADFERSKYRDHMQLHLKSLAQEENQVEMPARHDLATHFSVIEKRLAAIPDLGKPHEIRVEATGDKSVKVSIDLRNKTVRHKSDWDDIGPYHHFYVNDSVFSQWLKSEIQFEEVIGTRKFTLSRQPNLYSPDILRVINTSL